MKLAQAEKFWQARALQDMKSNMAGSEYVIERRPHGEGYSYCVSQYVCRRKVEEYWPEYTREFKATETFQGNPL